MYYKFFFSKKTEFSFYLINFDKFYFFYEFKRLGFSKYRNQITPSYKIVVYLFLIKIFYLFLINFLIFISCLNK